MSGWQIFDYSYWIISIAANLVFTIVITFGGINDLRYLFRELNKEAGKLNNGPIDES